MKKFLMIITTAALIASCNTNTGKPAVQNKIDSIPAVQNKIDSIYGVTKYVTSWDKNSFSESRSILYLVDTLKPDPSNPAKNVMVKDSFFVVAVPAVLIDSATRKPILNSKGSDSLVLVDKLIPKELVYDFKPVKIGQKKN